MSDEFGMDISDPSLIKEFKKLQQDRLDELWRRKDPSYVAESKAITAESILSVKNPLAE